MVLLYRAANAREAAVMRQALHANGIACELGGGEAATGFGELGADALRVDVLVPDERADEAKAVIEELQARRRADDAAWTCPACGETNDAGFDLCWSCGAQQPARARHGSDAGPPSA